MKGYGDMEKMIAKWDNYFKDHASDPEMSELQHDLLNVICAYVLCREYAESLEKELGINGKTD